MHRAWRRVLNIALFLEIHEIISLLTLLTLTFLYSIHLNLGTFVETTREITVTAGLITRTVFLIMLLMLGMIVAFPKWRFIGYAQLVFRIMTSFLIMLLSYEIVMRYIQLMGHTMYDHLLQKWDSFLFFGKQPAEWMDKLNTLPMTSLLSGAYLAWFPFCYGTIFLLLIKSRRAALEYATVALTSFYIGNIGYVLVPAVGPLFTHEFSTVVGGLTAKMLDPGFYKPVANCFPSLHTCISVVMLVQVWKYFRKMIWVYTPVTALIVFSTVYLRIHYAVDVFVGVVLAILTTICIPVIMTLWERLREQKARSQFTMIPIEINDNSIGRQREA
ncbi:phosphatase PAP2 family protein [Paenibacillus cremeus]|uniref:phosphatase PAP2 family protein n=1 Tax=Paenibacillus cremeus TaxID=2163881 RepID=UPI001C93BE7D|nr:phosphatase PAP2 family protein [Paenibacillus cremeus]